ncbi:CPBP family intramembrane metalloprotease [Kamptonema cortianum]|nr:CPBP family intramembrane glutamic endopeptidase [Oscillatoria laete-virens]MDK3158002.1 CPBP family intramembrane metalloprotease [Kamptonema cortianum]MDL5053120.1 CPBP family intramembrane metalloprotease [Oscillatoria laete-virens NRMC-F 0139]
MDNPETLSAAATWPFAMLLLVALICLTGYALWFMRMRHMAHFLKPRLEPSLWTTPDILAVLCLFFAAMLFVSSLRESLSARAGWSEDLALISSGLVFQLILLSGLLLLIALRRKLSGGACPFGGGNQPHHPHHGQPPKHRVIRLIFTAVTFQMAVWPVVLLTGQLNNWLMHLAGREPTLQKMVEILLGTDSMAIIGTLLFMAIVMAPVIEELVFRCFLYRWLKGRIPWPAAMVVSSATFALIHDAALFNVLPLTLLGCAFVMVYEHQRSLWAPILMHATFNCLQCIFILSLRGGT